MMNPALVSQFLPTRKMARGVSRNRMRYFNRLYRLDWAIGRGTTRPRVGIPRWQGGFEWPDDFPRGPIGVREIKKTGIGVDSDLPDYG